MTKASFHVDKLSRFLSYVLGRRPDEFGLVPDDQGFVRIKELVQALHEEQGWRHVRMAHINEVLITPAKPAIEIKDNRIRSFEMSRLPTAREPEVLPKLLYIAIRRRAYPSALDKGLHPIHRPHLILSTDKAMAMRMGRRLDNNPVLLTVQVLESIKRGTCLRQYGQLLYLADMLGAGTFSGPALPKEKPDAAAAKPPSTAPQVKTPGSYYIDPEPRQAVKNHHSPGKRRREPEWKKARRQARRHKERRNE